MVLTMATVSPTLILFIRASSISGLLIIFSYHLKVNPFSGKAMYFDLLNENSGRNRTGR